MHGILHAFRIHRSEVLGNDNPGAGRQTHEESNQHIDDRPYRTDCRECFIGYIVSDNPAVNHVVELLEDVSQQKRNRKRDNQPGNASLSHILTFR